MLGQEIDQRRSATGTRQGPPDPATTGLAVIRDGLPDWWREQNNLLLAGPDSEPNVPLQPSHFLPPASDSVVVIGARASPGQWSLSGEGALLVVGDGAMAKATETSVRANSTVLLGDGLNALFPARVIAANGGIVIVGPGGLWAKDVALMTDDLHTIRDRATGRRVNRFAGRIVVGSRVWLGWETVVYGDSHIGDGSVIGLRSFVRNCALPSHCVSAGQPVRVVRRNIEWLLDDLA